VTLLDVWNALMLAGTALVIWALWPSEEP